jgi:hypothetical protein
MGSANFLTGPNRNGSTEDHVMASQALTTPENRSATRQHLSSVMKVAHGLYRDESNDRTWGQCLAAAWKWVRRMQKWKRTNAFLVSTGEVGFVQSPVRNYYGAAASVGGRGSHAYAASQMGS